MKEIGKEKRYFPYFLFVMSFQCVCFCEGEKLTLPVKIGRKSDSCIMFMFKKQNIKYCKSSGSCIHYCQLYYQHTFYTLLLVIVSGYFDTATFSYDSSAVLTSMCPMM